MKLLRLCFTDTFGGIENFFTKVLSERYEIVRDDNNPDYLIFGDKNFGGDNINYDAKNCIKVFYTGENARPWDYRCHHSITFDHFEFDGQNYRLPLYVIYDYDNHFRDVPNTSTINRSAADLLQPSDLLSDATTIRVLTKVLYKFQVDKNIVVVTNMSKIM